MFLDLFMQPVHAFDVYILVCMHAGKHYLLLPYDETITGVDAGH